MMLKLLTLTALALLPVRAFELPEATTQCIVGIAADWNSSTVTLQLFEKHGHTWKPVAKEWPGRLGKNGLVWGRGISPTPAGASLKKEGDGRSPAGVYRIGGAWGYAAKIRKFPALDYRQITSRDLWVEDPASPKYNCNVILDREPATAWEKKQQMRQDDPVHALKLFIAHNAPPKVVPGAGSSIFFHIWRNGGTKATAGCTTMDSTTLGWLISKIDPARRPLYVLLTKADYQKYRAAWKLP